MYRKLSIFGLLLFCALFPASHLLAEDDGAPPPPPDRPSNAIPGKKLTAETEFKTALGGRFRVPKGWSISASNGIYKMRDPDNQFTYALMETRGEDPKAAIDFAWKTVFPEESKEVFQVDCWKHEGKFPVDWERIVHASYDIPPENSTVFWAIGMEKNKTCYVFLAYGNRAAADRREAQLNVISESLKLPGFVGEMFKGMTAYNLDEDHLKSLEEFIGFALDECKIPGAAVGIVQDGKVVYEKGFGVCEKGKPAPVTPQTLFMIGSTTKPLSSLLVARLVDQRKLNWSTPVSKILPSFRLGDPALTRELKIQDDFCACTGIPRNDTVLGFDTAQGTAEGLMGQMAELSPTTGFGEAFQYSNQMVAAGGYLAAHALYPDKPLGQAYDDAMQSQVFDPLGMKDSTLDPQAALQKNHASPHWRNFQGDPVPFDLSLDRWMTPARPAMGIWSNVDDLSQYLLMELSGGQGPDGKPFVSKKNLLKRREPQVEVSAKSKYGLGLFLRDDHGFHYVGHDGTVAGYSSLMAFYPDLGVGLVILVNADRSVLFSDAVRDYLFELLFASKPRAREQLKENQERLAFMDKSLEYRSDFDNRDLFNLIKGDFECDELGKASIQVKGDKAFFVTPGWTIPIARYKRTKEDKLIRIILGGPPFKGALLTPNWVNGRLTLLLINPQRQYVFKQVQPGAVK